MSHLGTPREIGTVDEYGTVWDGLPGASRIIGDLIPSMTYDGTSTLVLYTE